MDDIEVLKGMLGSVYLTPEQREALGRLLRGALRREAAAERVSVERGAPLGVVATEELRQALLGPCGAV